MNSMKINKILYYLLKPFLKYGGYYGCMVDHKRGYSVTSYILEFPFGIYIVERNLHSYPSAEVIKSNYVYVGRKTIDELKKEYVLC